MREQSISHFVKMEAEPEFLPKLRKFVVDYNINSDDLYYIINGYRVKQCDKTADDGITQLQGRLNILDRKIDDILKILSGENTN